ncbi:MAG: helix-turn-helix domain-containing protein [Nitrospirota bacterium]
MQARRIRTSREVGERVKKRRRELGISQERLAEIIGVTYQQVQRYENGTNRLNVEKIQIIADTLDVHVSYFFEDKRTIDTNMVSEGLSPPYISGDEGKLLKYFKRIRDSRYRDIVIQVARLISRVRV